MITKIDGGILVSNRTITENKGIYIENGYIRPPSSTADEYIDATGCFITPGFIDIHTHGAMGYDFCLFTNKACSAISKYHAAHGVTSLVATTMTMPIEYILDCAESMRSLKNHKFEGARILGLHLEGPFLSIKNRGAHSEKFILPCTYENYAPLLPYTDVIVSMTVSPHTEESIKMISEFAGRGVVISAGHDDSYEPLIVRGIEAGLSHTTHLFCAMSAAQRRNSAKYLGLQEMALLRDELTTEVIVDGNHTNQAMVSLAYKCKGADRLCLVSDMLSVGGLPADGNVHQLTVPGVEGGIPVVVADGAARLAGQNLNAGSITPLDQMVRNVCGYNIPLEDAIEMATGTPARVIHMDCEIGSIEVGKRADICILGQDLQVRRTLVGGNTVFNI